MTSFAQITSNVQVQKELQQAYGNVNNIDAFEGGLAEDHVAGSDMGQLFTTILANQFTRLRSGDRFFYLNETWNPRRVKHLPAGQHAGQGHRGEHADHQPAERRVRLPGIDQRDGLLTSASPRDRRAWPASPSSWRTAAATSSPRP